MNKIILDIIGSCGVFLLFFAQCLLFNKKIVANSKTYHIINFMGSILVTINVSFLLLYHFIILDIMWMIISGYGIYKNIYKNEKNEENDENEEEKI